MAVALDNAPEAPLKQPQDIVSVRVSADTGKLATAADDTALFEIFAAGTEPEATPEDYDYAEADIFVEQGGDDSSIF
jgi:membrane carboxypeptidase/penicillin-binding protein